jgi:hypothetical protein
VKRAAGTEEREEFMSITFEDLEIEDNYLNQAMEARNLQKMATGTGQLIGGLILSTESRKSKLASLPSLLFVLLSTGPQARFSR